MHLSFSVQHSLSTPWVALGQHTQVLQQWNINQNMTNKLYTYISYKKNSDNSWNALKLHTSNSVTIYKNINLTSSFSKYWNNCSSQSYEFIEKHVCNTRYKCKASSNSMVVHSWFPWWWQSTGWTMWEINLSTKETFNTILQTTEAEKRRLLTQSSRLQKQNKRDF